MIFSLLLIKLMLLPFVFRKHNQDRHVATAASNIHHKGENPQKTSNRDDKLQPQELLDFPAEKQATSGSDGSNSTDTIKGPPTPKPRFLKRDGSQTSLDITISGAQKTEEDFVFPTLKPVISSGTSDKTKAEPGPLQTDFRSVLKPRAQVTGTTQTKSSAESEATTDFRSVLSKPRPTDRDYTTTAGGFPRTDPVGVELRNLQMTRTSRNVVFRSHEPKFGVSSLVGSRDTPSSGVLPSMGSRTHPEGSSVKPSSHVNATGLRMVSKNLGTLDSWDHQQSSGQFPLSARGDKEWNRTAPSYSPSSCASVSHNVDSDTSGYSLNPCETNDIQDNPTKSNSSCLPQSKTSTTALNIQQEQDEIPPQLPSSPPPVPTSSPPLLPLTKSSNSEPKDPDGGTSSKCVSFLQFTPSNSESSTPLQPVVFNFTLPESCSSPNLKQTSPRQEGGCAEDTPGISDSSRDESDDVFTDHLEVAAEGERRGSIKAAGSVFAWEKIPSKSPEISPLGEVAKKLTENNRELNQGTKKKTCFNLDDATSYTKIKQSKNFNAESASPSPKTPSSSSKTKSVSSDAEFTKIKLRSTGIKPGPTSDLKKSKFLSTSTESLFFNVKLKPVVIKDVDLGEESSLASNPWSAKAKSKSSGDLLRDVNNERQSGSSDQVQTAREPAGFSEKLSAFENKGSETDRTEFSRKPNFTIPKRNPASKAIFEATKKENGERTGQPRPDNRLRNSNTASQAGTQVSNLEQRKLASTLPKDQSDRGPRVAGTEYNTNSTRSRHSIDISSRMENVPNWVKEKALGKRPSLTVDSGASTLSMRSNNNVQNTRDRIAKLKDNPSAPKTPRRFKRDQPQPEDRLSKTLGSDDLPRQLVPRNDIQRDGNKTTVSSIKSVSDKSGGKGRKFGQKPDFNNSAPEWAHRRNLKAVEPSLKVGSGSTTIAANKSNHEEHNKPLDTNTKTTTFTSLISKFNHTSSAVDMPLIKNRIGLKDLDPDSKNEHSHNIENKETGSRKTGPGSKTSELFDSAENAKTEDSNTTSTQSDSQPPRPSLSIAIDSKSQDSHNQQIEYEDPSMRDKQPPRKGIESLSKTSTIKQTPPQDLSTLNNQPSLRSTAVRPAWKKQRSLRHIPIYPIHDNELSPRYEPFVDDSESTASISSTSSEASIITNDSGYNSRSRANTSDLKLYPSHLSNDTQEHHKQLKDNTSDIIHQSQGQDRDEYVQKRMEKGQNEHGKIDQIHFQEGRDDHERFQKVGRDGGLYQEDNFSPKLITSASSVIDHRSHDDIPPQHHIPNPLINKELPAKDKESSVTHDLLKVGTQAPDDRETEDSFKENTKLAGINSESVPEDKDLGDLGDSDKPTGQILNLKNNVSYLDSTRRNSNTETEAVSFPRRRSKFMDNYMNGRRGSEEAAVTRQSEGNSDAGESTVKPPAKRPADLDIVPRWKRSQPAVVTCAPSARSKVKDETYSTKDKSAPDAVGGAESVNGLAAAGSPESYAGEIESAPVFLEPLEGTKQVLYGSSAILRCTVTGKPSPHVQWLFNRQPLQVRIDLWSHISKYLNFMSKKCFVILYPTLKVDLCQTLRGAVIFTTVKVWVLKLADLFTMLETITKRDEYSSVVDTL